MENWVWANGRSIIENGRSLRELKSKDLVDAALFLMSLQTKTTKEEFESFEKFEQRLSDLIYEQETGMPAITKWMAPADGSPVPNV